MDTADRDAPRYWVGVVSRAHVEGGVAGGFAQVSHGKERPLRRLRPGEWLIYYSPRTALDGGEPLQAFTAIGRVMDDRVYSHRMSGDFVPFRRDVAYLPCREAPIAPLLERLSFIRDKRRWGYPFRSGLIEIPADDFAVIAAAMGVAMPSAREAFHSPDPFDSAYDTPAESPGFLLWQVTNLWQRQQRAVLKEVDLTHVQFVLLAVLTWLTREGSEISGVSQAQLAQHAQVDVMMTSQVVRTLEDKGLLKRAPHPRDARANLLQVTSRGRDVAGRSIHLVERTDREFFAALEDDIAHFTRELRSLLRTEEPTAQDSRPVS